MFVVIRPLHKGEVFSINSARPVGEPLGIVIYKNGIIYGRLTACCEYKYRPNARLGGPSGQFKLVCITKGEPCSDCLEYLAVAPSESLSEIEAKMLDDIGDRESSSTENETKQNKGQLHHSHSMPSIHSNESRVQLKQEAIMKELRDAVPRSLGRKRENSRERSTNAASMKHKSDLPSKSRAQEQLHDLRRRFEKQEAEKEKFYFRFAAAI